MNTLILTPGEKLKELRKIYNIKQHELSKSNISRNMISMIETNKANLIESTAKNILDNVREICKRKGVQCNISIDYLIESAEAQAEKIAKDFIIIIDKTPEKILEDDFQIDLSKIISILDRYNLKDYKATIYEMLGNFYENHLDYYKAYTYYLTAFESYTNLFNNEDLVHLIIGIIYCCGKLNRHKEQLEFSNLARIYMPNMSLESSYKLSYNDALSYKNLKNYEKALTQILSLEESFKDFLDSNMSRRINVIIIKANCYTELKNFKKALDIHKETLKLTENDVEMSLLVLGNMLDIYTELKDSKNLKKYLDKCTSLLSYYYKLEYKKYYPEILNEIGYAFYFLHNYGESKIYLTLSLEESVKYNRIPCIEKSMSTLLKIYSIENNEEEIDSLKNELLELISLKILPHNNDLVFKFVNYYSSIKDNSTVTDITNFVISQSPSDLY